MTRGRDLFSPSIYRLRRARWRARSDHGRVRVRLSGGRTTRRRSAATWINGSIARRKASRPRLLATGGRSSKPSHSRLSASCFTGVGD